jgi:glycosyltransferase involved in cell wall biosynthesis
MRKRVLIINYGYPPNPGVGGRRWAKFSKYLNRLDCEVHVLAASPTSNATSNWADDTKEVNVHFYKSKYLKALGIHPSTLWEHIRYKMALFWSKLKVKGNYYDKGARDKKDLLSATVALISEKKIETVIVSVAPFSLAYFIMEVIPDFPEVKFIVDFRDPWTENRTSYGLGSMSKQRKQVEKELEQKVIHSFHHVTSVSKVMNDHFKKLTKDQNKFSCIPNGYDPEDFQSLQTEKNTQKGLNMVFAGGFYANTEYLSDELVVALDKLQKEQPHIFEDLSFHFYVGNSLTVKNLAVKFDNVTSHQPVTKSAIVQVIENSDAGLLFLSEDIQYSFSTKFCEYIALKKPIVIFSKEGPTMNYILKNEIGFGVRSGSIYEDLISLHKSWESGNLAFNNAYDDSDFNLSKSITTFLNLMD